MLIEEKALTHWIDNFYGYGSWQARFWFIGYEEDGGDLPEEVADKLNYFQDLPAHSSGQLCDIREMYRHVAFRTDGPKAELFSNLYDYRFGNIAIQHSVWKNLTAFVHGLRKKKLPDLFKYQKASFASPSLNSEAWIQLYPLPSPHNHAWYYSWLDLPQLDFLKSRAQYEERMYQRRMHHILSKVRAHKPDVVLMYGMNGINTLKKSVQEFFDGASFKTINATKRQIPQHHRVNLNGTMMLITSQVPTLRHNRAETGFDWEEFGKRVRTDGTEVQFRPR